MDDVRIYIRDGDKIRQVTKIIGTSEGGFSILPPYHMERTGFLSKFKVDYSKTSFWIPLGDMLKYSAEDQVKLTFHADGFTQFSSIRQGSIKSGRNLDGSPKGVGIVAAPLSELVRSGPTFGVTLWGLAAFREAPPKGKAIIFEQEDLYMRSGPKPCNGIKLEGFIFPEHFWAGVREEGTKLVLHLAFTHFQASGAVLTFRVVPLDNGMMIGLIVSKVALGFEPPSGFMLSSKSDPDSFVLMAMYPPISNLSEHEVVSVQRTNVDK